MISAYRNQSFRLTSFNSELTGDRGRRLFAGDREIPGRDGGNLPGYVPDHSRSSEAGQSSGNQETVQQVYCVEAQIVTRFPEIPVRTFLLLEISEWQFY